MTDTTKQRLLDAGLELLLEHGYYGLGVQALLEATGTPKGSFYHHFASKEDFALQVIDQYMIGVHQVLAACLDESGRRPLQRMRDFFETVAESYRGDGYLGCLLGGLGQELSGVNEVFARKIDDCFTHIAERMASCLEDARIAGDIAPSADVNQWAGLLVDCWEGAALRSRLRRSEAPLKAMLDFYFRSATATR
jgi:TetR/AcrR family transcriptional repressor of nem operon